jgi:hypothetical protein
VNSSIRKDELAVALLSSVFVGFAVVLATRRLAIWKCLPSVPPDTYGLRKVEVWNVYFDWAGCQVLAPLEPMYLGGLFLFGIAAWTRRRRWADW